MSNVRRLVRDFFYSAAANAFTLFVAAVVSLILPKITSVEDYGYIELFKLYCNYCTLFHLGIPDGIYVRLSGLPYDKINKNEISFQLWALIGMEAIMAAIFIFLGRNSLNSDKGIIIASYGIFLLIANIIYFLQNIFMATDRIKDYACMQFVNRGLYCAFLICSIFLGIRSYRLVLYAEFAARMSTLILGIYLAKDIVFKKINISIENIRSYKATFCSGVWLMLASITSMFIMGIMQVAIERQWGIETFGKISLTLNISSLLMIFINAVSVVIFPALKRVDTENMAFYYNRMRNLLMIVLLSLLIFYYPGQNLLSFWLPKYTDSLRYMALLFPICVFECKNNMLSATYLKALDKGKIILFVNIVAVAAVVICAYISINLLESLELSMLSITLLIGGKATLMEGYISKFLSLHLNKDIFLEWGMVVGFMIINWKVNNWMCVVMYMFLLSIYLFAKRKQLVFVKEDICLVMKK